MILQEADLAIQQEVVGEGVGDLSAQHEAFQT
jgi:hypothetical protein